MTTEERLEKIERELIAAKQINRWKLTAVVLAASLLCMVAKDGFFVTPANAGDVDVSSIEYDVGRIKSTVGNIESTVANIERGIGIKGEGEFRSKGFNSRDTLYNAVDRIQTATGVLRLFSQSTVTGVPRL